MPVPHTSGRLLDAHKVKFDEEDSHQISPLSVQYVALWGRKPLKSTSKSQIPLRCPACDQLASWSQAGQRNGNWSRTASELDSIVEFGLNRSATRFHPSGHVEIARTWLRQVGN